MTRSSNHRWHPGLALIGWLLLTFCAPALGVFGMPGEWYEGLTKPSWNPPPWVFGPVWSLLYVMMAVAAWLVWRRGGWRLRRKPLGLYLAQLVLNAAWTPVFFGLRQPAWALLVILLLLASVVATTLTFFRADKAAGCLFVPYLLWVGFASFLNLTLWLLNR